MRQVIKSLTLAVLLVGSGGTASAITYVFDQQTPFLPANRMFTLPFKVIVADSIWTQGGTVSIHERTDGYTPLEVAYWAGVPYLGVELGGQMGGWRPGEVSPCIPEVGPVYARWSCRVADEWLSAWEFALDAEFSGNLLVGGGLTFIFPQGFYRMVGDSDGLWTVTDVQDDGYYCEGVNECGATGRFVRVPEPGTLALLGIGLAGVGFTRRRKA